MTQSPHIMHDENILRRLTNRLFHRATYRTAMAHHHVRLAFFPYLGNNYQPHVLRRRWLQAYAAILVIVKVAVVLLVGIYADVARVSDVSPTNIIHLTNQSRQKAKVAGLRSNPLLTKAAESKANDMVRQHYFAHISPSGTSPWVWFKKAGYAYSYAGENLALDFIESEDVIAAWLNSPSHRRNLLSTKYRDIGVAVTTARINGVDSPVVVQMFGAPLPPPVVKKVTVPAQSPLPAAAKQQLAATPPPPPPVKQVLGETAPPPQPPNVPTLTTPAADTIVRTGQPEFIGRADPASTVTLYLNGTRIATATAAADGVFFLTLSSPLEDGTEVIQVSATAQQLTSELSSGRTITIDTAAPTYEPERSVLLPSYLYDDGYDAVVTVTGEPTTVSLAVGGRAVAMLPQGESYVGFVRLGGPAAVPGVVTVKAADRAGNAIDTVLADPELMTTGVVASPGGPAVTALKIVFFSRTFLLTFLVLMLIAATLNVVVKLRHQHHPTIIGTLLVIYLAGTLLIM